MKRMSTMERTSAASWSLLMFACMPSLGQSSPPTVDPATQNSNTQPSGFGWKGDSETSGPGVGVAVKFSLLGAGIEGATRVTHRSNVRGGFNMISYDRTFDKDGISYAGQLQFKTIEAHYDFFPWAGNFHISPGVLAYLGDPITATATAPANQSFSLGGVTYYSDPTNPAHGT